MSARRHHRPGDLIDITDRALERTVGLRADLASLAEADRRAITRSLEWFLR